MYKHMYVDKNIVGKCLCLKLMDTRYLYVRLFSLFLQARTRQSGGTIHTVSITKDSNLIHIIAVNVLPMKLHVV